MKLIAFIARLLGLLGVLLCAGAVAGTLLAEGKVTGHVDRAHEAVDGLIDGVQIAVGEALPRIGAARKRLAVKATEMVVPELGHLRARLENVARTGEAVSGVLDALNVDGVKLAELRARIGELREAARELTDRPEKREPALSRAEAMLTAIHQDLSDLRLRAAEMRNRTEQIAGRITLALAGFFVWMGLGQLCMAAGRRRRDEAG